MRDKAVTTVLDAGGRYGLHPTWKPFKGELNYFLFEPDHKEAARLTQKYAHRDTEIKIVDMALSDRVGKKRLFLFRNRAMSSCYDRNPICVLFDGERKREVDIEEEVDVETTTVDQYCRDHDIEPDFIKVDTEGGELQVLEGAGRQLDKGVLAVRCEVSFDRIFEGAAMFSDVHQFMLDRGFYLLNLSYDGKGDYCNEFVGSGGKYGILTSCDAVWMRRHEAVFSGEDREINILKYAAFCMNNDANDVAIDILLQARERRQLSFDRYRDTKLHQYLEFAVHKLLYSLKWIPGQSLERNKEAYLKIFDTPMMEMHEYNQSTVMNPD
jgi:FkbM family methyltransferase